MDYDSEDRFERHVIDALERLPGAHTWSPDYKEHVKERVKNQISLNLKRKLVKSTDVKEGEMVEFRIYFTKRGFTNLLNGKSPLLNPDADSDEGVMENEFRQNVITRVNIGENGQQEFPIDLDTSEGFTVDDTEKVTRLSLGGITQYYVLKKDSDLMT